MFKLRFLFLLAGLLFFSNTNAQNIIDTTPSGKHINKIDKITGAKDVERLLGSIDKHYAHFKVNDLNWKDKDYKNLCDSLHVQSFAKADFDNNGHTDLLVLGEHPYLGVFCVMDSGDNKFVIKMVSRSPWEI